MKDSDLVPARLSPADVARLGGTGLRTRPLRTVLAALGIAIGVAAMVAIIGISASGAAEVRQRLDDLGPNLLRVTGAHRPGGGELTPLPTTARSSVARIGPVESAAATASLPVAVYRNAYVPSGETGSIGVLAADRALAGTVRAQVAFGSWFTPASEHFPSVVLGAGAAQHLGVDRVGTDVVVGGRLAAVVGVLNPVPLAPELDGSVLLGWDAARTYYGFGGSPTTLYARVEQSQLDAVVTLVPRSVSPVDPDTVVVDVPSDAIAAREAATSTQSGLLVALAGVALVIGGIGIANTMVVSVLERRPEIGLRRALGATRGQVRVQFVGEAVLLSLLGGVAGVLCGSMVTLVHSRLHGWPIVVPWWVSTAGIGVTVVIGALSGAYPAVRASRTSPTAALATL